MNSDDDDLEEIIRERVRRALQGIRQAPQPRPVGLEFPIPRFRCDQTDAAHLAITAVHRGGVYFIHDLFIKKHEKFILKQMVRDHEALLERLDELAGYHDEETKKELRDYLEEKHTFVGFNISKEELRNVVTLALLSSGEAAAAGGLHELVRKPIDPETSTSAGFIRGFGTLFELPAKIYYLCKAEGWYGFLRGIGLALSAGFIEELGEFSDSLVVKAGFRVASDVYRSIYRLKVFNNFCRNTWIDYVLDNPSRLRELIQEFAQARKEQDKQAIVEAVKKLQTFVAKGHNIPEFRKIIS